MSILTTLFGGGTAAVVTSVGSTAEEIRAAITGKVTPADQALIEQKLLDLKGKAADIQAAVNDGQAKINAIEAASPSFFNSGWRPFLCWSLSIGFAYQYILVPFVNAFIKLFGGTLAIPDINLTVVTPILLSVLGVARSVEKVKGVARDNMVQ
jgi:hypothetical protein